MNTKNNPIKDILSQINTIVKKHNEIAASSGDNFNIFNILNLSTAEVRLHSKLLAELLNPKGSHHLGDVFLKLFLQKINKSKNKETELEFSSLENVYVEVEKYAGKINKETDIGGNIDIYISLPNQKEIIIENKIYAGDQERQLRRYHSFGKTKKPVIIYLTLEGREANDSTTGNDKYLNDKITPILLSYESDIKEWLEDCRKEAAILPLVRETITQYINLIKQLTGQSMNINMKNEIVKAIMESGDKIRVAFEIASSINDVKKNLLKKFANEITLKVKEMKPEIETLIKDNFGKKWEGTDFYFPKISNLNVYFSFLTDYNNSYLEIQNDQNLKSEKLISNINYYRGFLDHKTKNWGKIENAEKGWQHGDWVCRYEKMDRWIQDGSIWYEVAENNFQNMVEIVSKDIIVLLEAIEKKPRE